MRGFPIGNLARHPLDGAPGGRFLPGNAASTLRGLFDAGQITNLHSHDCKVSPSAGPLTFRSDLEVDVTQLLRPEDASSRL
jgi:hypothetical protein